MPSDHRPERRRHDPVPVALLPPTPSEEYAGFYLDDVAVSNMPPPERLRSRHVRTGKSTGPRATTATACTERRSSAAAACAAAGPRSTRPPETASVSVAADKATYSWSAATFATQLRCRARKPGRVAVRSRRRRRGSASTTSGPVARQTRRFQRADTGFWYLSRGENSCGNGTLTDSRATGRRGLTTTCP